MSGAVSTLHRTGLALGAVIAGLLGAGAVARIGRGNVMRVGLLGLSAGIVLFTRTTALPVTLLVAAIAGVWAGLVVNTHGTVLADHPLGAGPSAINKANALTAAIGVLGPVANGVCAGLGIGWRVGMLATLGLAAAALLDSRGVALPDRSSGEPPARGEAASTLAAVLDRMAGVRAWSPSSSR